MVVLSAVVVRVSATEQGGDNGVAMPDFSYSFKTLRTNRTVYRAYQDSVHSIADNDAWLAFMHRRAGIYHDLYAQNTAVIDGITRYFGQPSSASIPDAAYDSLFFWTSDMYEKSYDDVFLLELFSDLLLPHYESLSDTTHLLTLNHFEGYCNVEIARAYEREVAPKAIKYIRRNLEYGKHYERLDPGSATSIPADYMNICFTLSALGQVKPSEALALIDDYEAFLRRNRDLLPPERLPRYDAYLDRLRSTAFVIHVDNSRQWSREDSLAIAKMYEASPYSSIVTEFHDGIPVASKNASSILQNTEDSIFYYHSLVALDRITYDCAYRECDKILVNQIETMSQSDSIGLGDIQQVSNNMIATLEMMENGTLSESFMTERVVYYTERLVRLIQRAAIEDGFTFFDYMLSKLACDESIFRHLPTSMKEQFMSELAVKMQIGTVVHVNMVELLCAAMLDRLLDLCPEQFVGILGCRDVSEVQGSRDEFMQYMAMASRFHDLGKNRMSEIVGNDYRRLTDHEYAIIKKHPELSLEYLNMDPLFDKYKDVALGHHKWYNGQGGYPMSFDNVGSPWRAIIDLLTICDCIDAATDYLGRNYRYAKTLDQVLDEFRRDAGIRYNPVMVDALANDTELRDRISLIITDDRIRQAANVRQRYMHNDR